MKKTKKVKMDEREIIAEEVFNFLEIVKKRIPGIEEDYVSYMGISILSSLVSLQHGKKYVKGLYTDIYKLLMKKDQV